jgi:hypothetical protein
MVGCVGRDDTVVANASVTLALMSGVSDAPPYSKMAKHAIIADRATALVLMDGSRIEDR